MVDTVLDSIEELFFELDLKPEVFVLSKIHPLNLDHIIKSVQLTKKLYTVEEDSAFGGFGAEVTAQVCEALKEEFICARVASLPTAIASAKSLESEVLTNKNKIIKMIKDSLS